MTTGKLPAKLPQYVRKTLDIRGKSIYTWHDSCRLNMEYDCGSEQLIERFNAAVVTWTNAGLIEEFVYVGPKDLVRTRSDFVPYARLQAVFKYGKFADNYNRMVVLETFIPDLDDALNGAQIQAKLTIEPALSTDEIVTKMQEYVESHIGKPWNQRKVRQERLEYFEEQAKLKQKFLAEYYGETA